MLTGSRPLLALTCVIATTLGASAPAGAVDAPPAKIIRSAETCPWYMPPDWSDKHSLNLELAAGRWFSEEGDSIPCYDQFYDDFRPSIPGKFVATVRWYAGKKLLRKQRREVTNGTQDGTGYFSLNDPRLQESSAGWVIRNARVRAKVTFTKKGYRPYRVTVADFYYPSE